MGGTPLSSQVTCAKLGGACTASVLRRFALVVGVAATLVEPVGCWCGRTLPGPLGRVPCLGLARSSPGWVGLSLGWGRPRAGSVGFVGGPSPRLPHVVAGFPSAPLLAAAVFGLLA